jgi:hypothetical protein
MKHSLNISLSDLWRATLEDRSGNVGFIGLAPDGSGYHVVVPVDLQIARGVKAGNRPTDGTPFGGYRGWHYFQCRPFSATLVQEADREARARTAVENGRSLVAWAAGLGVAVQVVDDQSGRIGP